MDMSNADEEATHRMAPQAEIVHDKFHVAKQLNEAVDQVRRAENKVLRSRQDARLKGTRQLWLYAEDNLTEKQILRFGDLRDSDLKTARAWALKENFRWFWTCQYAGNARKYCRELYGWACRCRLPPIIKAAKMLHRQLDNLLTYMRHPITNAAAEGFNRKIQAIKSNARGFRSVVNYRLRILFVLWKTERDARFSHPLKSAKDLIFGKISARVMPLTPSTVAHLEEHLMSLAGPPLTRPISIGSLLSHGLSTKPDDLALVSAVSRMSWRQLDEISTRLAAQYLALGLEPGDRVASLMPNRPALIVHYLACFKAGFVATPLNYRYMPPEIDHALEVSGASLLLHHAERDTDVAASKLGTQLPKGVIRYKAADSRGRHYEELVAQPQTHAKIPAPDPDAPAFIYFTSGSTGKPKGVTHTQRTYGWMLASTIQGMGITGADTFLPGASFSHIGGSLFGLSTLAAGGRLVIPRGSDGHEILPLLREDRPTVLWMLPAALIALVRDHDAVAADFSSIRLCVSGGDKVARELEREFTEMAGFPVDESYGMTEFGLATINPPTGENRVGSIGKLCPGYEMSLRDDSGGEVPVGTQGGLWIRSPANAIGYWDNQEATAETVVDGWLDTGDVMRVDEDGYLWFCGRKKQIIIHDGSNICPQEVEEAVAEHPAIEVAGVIGVHDLVHGENVRAYVTLKAGATRPTSAALIRFARERVGYKAPEEIVVLAEMPLNATGKVDRVTLKQMAEEQFPTSATGGEK